MTKQLWQFNESPQRLNDIAREVVSLRRENRFLKVGLVFCLVLSALPYLTGFQPETIRVKRLVVEQIDFAKGELVTLSIAMDKESPDLVVKDATNKPVYRFLHPHSGRGFWVYNAEGKPTAYLSSGLYGGSLILLSNDEKAGAAIAVKEDGGVVIIANKDGKTAASMEVKNEGGWIAVTNKDETPVVQMAVIEGGGHVVVFDKEKKSSALMGVSDEGGLIAVTNRGTKIGAMMTAHAFGGVITLNDRNGKPVWSAP
jgi:hypothetical protein